MSSNLTAADFKNCSGNWGNLATGGISCVWVYQVESGVYRARNISQKHRTQYLFPYPMGFFPLSAKEMWRSK